MPPDRPGRDALGLLNPLGSPAAWREAHYPAATTSPHAGAGSQSESVTILVARVLIGALLNDRDRNVGSSEGKLQILNAPARSQSVRPCEHVGREPQRHDLGGFRGRGLCSLIGDRTFYGGGVLPTSVKVLPTVQRARPKVPVSLRDPRKAGCSAMPRSSVRGESADVAAVPRSSLSSRFDTTIEARSVNPAGRARTRNSCPSFAAPVSESIAVDCRPISEGFPIHPVTGVPLDSTNR